MAVGDGSAWDETNPTNSTLAISIDDYDRDMRIGVRSRMQAEHEWPSSQSATNQAGQHKFVTLQQQASKPTVSGTQLGAIYMKTVGAGLQELFWENEAGTEVQISHRGVAGNIVSLTGTQITGVITVTSTGIPVDGTPPQINEGDQVVTFAYTPQSATNIISINGVFTLFSSGDSNKVIFSLFNNASTALSAIVSRATIDTHVTVPINWVGLAGTTGSITFQVRGGKDQTGSLRIGGSGSVSAFGSCNGNILTITEFAI